MYLLILISLLFIYLITRPKKESVLYPLPKYTKSIDKIKMYGRNSCGYTIKMKDQIKKENLNHMFHFIDVSKEPGLSQFKNMNGNGVPMFKRNGRVAVGFMPTSELFSKLGI